MEEHTCINMMNNHVVEIVNALTLSKHVKLYAGILKEDTSLAKRYNCLPNNHNRIFYAV